ncbi:MAG TPA: hypothetical protein VHT05_06110 [Candidatus Elarobacter sp.]|nr:hypothetical protein [Candidatus Elarobacter sp.]
MDSLIASLRGWTPVHVAVDEPRIDWAVLDGPPCAPFFEQDAEIAMRRPFNEIFARRTAFDVLDAFAGRSGAREPAGFVFHMSRCGSTLVAQMLSRVRSLAVLSEPQPFDAVLRRHAACPSDVDGAVRALRGLARAFDFGPQRRLVVKLHAWHVLLLPLLRLVFPDVPCAFVFREPSAVLRSQQRHPGAEVMPGLIPPPLLGFAGGSTADDPEFRARVIAAFGAAALHHASDGCTLFLDYDELPEGVVTRLAPWFGIELAGSDREAIRAVASASTKRHVVADLHAKRGVPKTHAHERVPDDVDRGTRQLLEAQYAALRASS